MESTDRKEADFYHIDGDHFVCDLCPHGCRIKKGQYGLCGSRFGDDVLLTTSYGRASSVCINPIEKKPLYHYHPGSDILSVGGYGCNMRCRHCQNHSISQTGQRTDRFIPPEELIDVCRREGLDSIAFTYNEPTVWFEYIRDVMQINHEIRFVLVTNGLISEAPLRELCRRTDAMNIDVKGFTDEFYTKVCSAHLQDVLDTVKISFGEGVHIELTYLLIPGYNDSKEELNGFSSWVKNELSEEVPIHFTRFHPDHKMTDIPCTPINTMVKAKGIAENAGLKNVYLGNVSVEGCGDTHCPECGKVLIERSWYDTNITGLKGNSCSYCGRELYLRDRTG